MTTYKDSGVDIAAGEQLVDLIKPIVKNTNRPGVLGNLGGFGGLFELDLSKYKNPVLVSATDGVGTKLQIAFKTGNHNTVGIDLVAMCVNDIVVSGAEPLFFLDYYATGRLEVNVAKNVISGIAEGCKQAGCSLSGGETAEMPSFYSEGEYDLAGFCVGIIEKDKIKQENLCKEGDVILGIESNGVHSNGFSLVRKVLVNNLSLDEKIVELGHTLGEELLRPTKIYVKPLLKIFEECDIHGAAHITGGGITRNLPRIIPNGLSAEIMLNSWDIPTIFELIRTRGDVPFNDMYQTFNMGIGMALILGENETKEAVKVLDSFGLKSFDIGRLVENDDKEPVVDYILGK